jgi:uncharacterized RDD family membrane protein YckC
MSSALPDPDRHATFYQGVATARALAWGIDAVITGLITAAIVPLTGFVAVLFLPVLFGLVNMAYRMVALAQASATPGMWLLGIEFRGADGGRLTTATAILHTLGTLFTWSTVLPQIASAALMALHPRGQGLTDLVLGTVAIRRPGHI